MVIQGTSAAGTSLLPFRMQSLAPVAQASPSSAPSRNGASVKIPDGVQPMRQTTARQ
jgi:hypothetical protein